MTGWLVWEIMRAGKTRALSHVIDDIFDELKGSREEESAGAKLAIDEPSLTWIPMKWRKSESS